MDSRFYRAANIKFPLYTLDYKFHLLFKYSFSFSQLNNIRRTLTRKISEVYCVDDSNIRLFDSASSSILYLLKKLKKLYNIKRVYIPAFSCMDLADAVIASDCKLQVYDIDEEFKPLMSFLEGIKFENECALIIPSYFGACKLGGELIQVLEQMEMPIIFDDAQVFPMTPLISGNYNKPWFSVISFGKGKPISALGGGALISNTGDGNLNNKIFSDSEFKSKSSCIKVILSHVNRAVKNVFKNSIGLSDTKLFVSKKIFDSLEELVYAKEYQGFTPQGISKLQMIFALKRFYLFKKTVKRRCSINEYFAQLAETHKEFKYIKKELSHMNFIPLCIENEDRYKMLKTLGSYGIQCTIFYYPLHLIPFYAKKYDLQECPNSEALFSSIVIIPYNLDYNNKKVVKMLHLIEKSLSELKIYSSSSYIEQHYF